MAGPVNIEMEFSWLNPGRMPGDLFPAAMIAAGTSGQNLAAAQGPLPFHERHVPNLPASGFCRDSVQAWAWKPVQPASLPFPAVVVPAGGLPGEHNSTTGVGS